MESMKLDGLLVLAKPVVDPPTVSIHRLSETGIFDAYESVFGISEGYTDRDMIQ